MSDIISSSANKDFGSPFSTFARTYFPSNIREVMDWAEYLWTHQGVYAKAIQRAVRYFITSLEITGTSDYTVKKKYRDFLTDNLKVLDKLALMGDDYMGYGNSFVSIYRPFYRNLICPSCNTMHSMKSVNWKWASFTFTGKCPKCKRSVSFAVKDLINKQDDLRIVRWNPRHITLEHHEISGMSKYYYEPKGEVLEAIKTGQPMYAEFTPWEIIDAIKSNERFLFGENQIFHMRCEPAASMLSNVKGWGLPPFLANFEYVVNLQMLTKYNEAIAMDMIVPFRFISPGKSGGGPVNDPLLTIDCGNFMRNVEGMIRQHRKDPTCIHSIPYPVSYQALGGEAKSLAPVELMKFALDELLNSMGIPQEFYTGTLTAAGPPIGLRMFERTWIQFRTQIDSFLSWLMDQCSKHLMWEDLGSRLIRTSIIEDDIIKQTKLNLLAANKISNQTALGTFNIDYEYEMDKVFEEQQIFEEKAAEIARKAGKGQENQMFMDQPPMQSGMPMGQPGMPMGGMPMGQSGMSGGSTTLDEMSVQAEQIAQQILTMDPTSRKSELINLKKTNDTLHALVTSKLKELEQQAAQTGINMTRQGAIPPGGQ
ncbi:MAG: hypothetical protein EOM18_15240 [Clostridia bacterium]|nr:hypothetical protein [Clostridia bacterium]